MKKLTYLSTLLLAASSIVPVFGQTGERITANVPFPFTVGDTTLEAGTYEFDEVNQSLVMIREDSSNGGGIYAIMNPADNPPNGATALQTPSLLFHRYGGVYFLSQIHMEMAAGELPATKQEKQLMAANKAENAAVVAQVR